MGRLRRQRTIGVAPEACWEGRKTPWKCRWTACSASLAALELYVAYNEGTSIYDTIVYKT